MKTLNFKEIQRIKGKTRGKNGTKYRQDYRIGVYK